MFRILQNILKKNSRIDPQFDMRFKRGPERFGGSFLEGRMQVRTVFQWDYNSRAEASETFRRVPGVRSLRT